MFSLRKCDMDPVHAKFVLETINLLQERNSAKSDSWSDLCINIKGILDLRFGCEWNILIGKAVGYAMKAKKKCAVVAANSAGEVIVCWKSPGFEVEDSSIFKIKATLVMEGDTLLKPGPPSAKLTVVRAPPPDSSEYTKDTPKLVNLVDSLLDEIKDSDNQAAARLLRNHITARFGTIWHVAVGETRAFHIEPARGTSDHVILASKKGGVRIEIFRHTQQTPSSFAFWKSMTLPKLSTILDVIPTILFMLLCILFMLQRSGVCQADSMHKSTITRLGCDLSHAIPLSPLAGAVFILTILKQVKKMLDKKRKQH